MVSALFCSKSTISLSSLASIEINFSKLSKDTVIYGNLDKGLKPLTDKFKNINISSKSFSKTKEYINFFYKDHLKNNFDIIEIHNRPEYLNYLIKKKINSKLIFFFISSLGSFLNSSI